MQSKTACLRNLRNLCSAFVQYNRTSSRKFGQNQCRTLSSGLFQSQTPNKDVLCRLSSKNKREGLLSRKEFSLPFGGCAQVTVVRCLSTNESTVSDDNDESDSASNVTVDSLCRHWTQVLEENNIPEARVSTEYIVAHVLGKKTLHSIRTDTIMDPDQVHAVGEMCERRLKHEPVQYILGEWDFDDLVLKLRPPVFIPRPETEELVGLAAKLMMKNQKKSGRLLELCCGSGAITLALLHRFPHLKAVAVDVSVEACNLAKENAVNLGLDSRISIIRGDLYDAAVQRRLKRMGPFDILVSNPPYIPSEDVSDLEPNILRYEDKRALDGGIDGLDIVRNILPLAVQLLAPGSDILLEIQTGQSEMIEQMVDSMETPELQYVGAHWDYMGRERFCHLRTQKVKARKR